MPIQVALDASFIVALLDEKDLWHPAALQLLSPLETPGFKQFAFDCVLSEVVSTLARRVRERRRDADLSKLIEEIGRRFPRSLLTWVYPDLETLYDNVIELVKDTAGELNFNDALIALACQTRSIPFLVSFDADFDQITWLKRVNKPTDLPDLS
jgi:predicted nucleic acid-binding protein